MSARRGLAVAVVALTFSVASTAACTGRAPTAARPAAAPAPSTAPGPLTASVRVGSAPLARAEVADTPAERGVGLMGRTAVPRGTGMVFRYPAPVLERYWMHDVPVPLTAVFVQQGRVVGVVDMAPCLSSTPRECPTYGVDRPYDTVLETAPETVRGRVAVGDRLTVA